MSLRCWIFGHKMEMMDYHSSECARCQRGNPYDCYSALPVWLRIPGRIKSWWRYKRKLHSVCPDCGNRQFIRKCNQDCIPVLIMTARNNFTAKTKRLVRERSGGSCEVHLIPEESRLVRYPALPGTCNRKAVDVDHIQPDWCGGSNTIDNAAHLCKPCHSIKTVTDNKEAKKRARRAGERGQQARHKAGKTRKIQSQAFVAIGK